jgi:UDP-glucose 4-epimerase
MSSFLITGGMGYVGGRLALALRRRLPGARVILGVRPGRDIPAWARDFETCPMILGDASMKGVLPRGVDVLVHLAALNEIQCGRDPLEAMRVNALGTHHLLEEAVRAEAARMIYFSTFHVYGPHAKGRITEATPTRSSHPYAYSHRAAEDVVDHFRERKGLPGAILRLSNAFGAPADMGVDRWTLVFNDLCRQAVDTGRLVLTSSGLQHRDFITLGDVASAVIHLASKPETWGDGLFNLGSGRSMSVLEAAGHVARVFAATFDAPPPPVAAASSRPDESHEPFTYCTGKLLETGFVPAAGMDAEIRACLELCAGRYPGRRTHEGERA